MIISQLMGGTYSYSPPAASVGLMRPSHLPAPQPRDELVRDEGKPRGRSWNTGAWRKSNSQAPSAARRRLEAKLAHGDLQVRPCLLFLAGIAQKERGVIGDDKLAAADGVDAPAESSKRLALAEQIG